MSARDPEKWREATAHFKLGLKADRAGVHRTLNRMPKGKGWVQCLGMAEGLMCRPEKVREAIGHYERAYATFPDIVALNQIAIAHEMLGETEQARESFSRMRQQALDEGNAIYAQAAEAGLRRLE